MQCGPVQWLSYLSNKEEFKKSVLRLLVIDGSILNHATAEEVSSS